MKHATVFAFLLLFLGWLPPGPVGGQTVAGGDRLAALCEAIQYQHWTEALRLVEAGTVVTGRDWQGRTPLGMLAQRWFGPQADYEPRLRLLHQLLERGADPFAAASTTRYPHGDHSIVEAALAKVDLSLGDILLTNRPSTTQRTPMGDTALHLAAQSGRTNAIDFLLSNGFSVNQTNNDGLTPLQGIVVLALKGTFILASNQPPFFVHWTHKGVRHPIPPEVADFLLSRGAKLDVWSAAGLGMTNQLTALLRTDPSSVNARDGVGRTPLHYAVWAYQTNSVALLLQIGADPSARTTKPVQGARPSKSSPLHFASQRGSPETTAMLLNAGASPSEADAEGNTALHLAVHWGATNCPSLLIHAQAPLDVKNRSGKTPLRVAVESGASANVELLLKAGARTDAGLGSNTLLHVAAAQSLPKYSNMGPEFRAGERSAQSIPVLLGHGMRVDTRDGEGRTPLQQAVTALNWKAMNLLLTNGADVNAVDARGNSALHQIVTQSWEYAVWDQWPPSLAESNRVTATVGQRFEASNSTNISVTSWLLEHGANPNLTNHVGRTPLELLCGNSWRHYDLSVATNRIALLLKAGAKVPNLDSKGQALLRQVVGEGGTADTGR